MKQSLCLITIIFFVFGCKPQEHSSKMFFPDDSTPINNIAFTFSLKENIEMLGNAINDFQILTDSSFLLVSGRNIFIYSNQGKQLGLVGSVGQGAHQYLSPDKIYVSEKYVYIWCRAQNKLFAYTKQGKYIKEYHTDTQSISAFVVYKEQLLCCLLDGTDNDKIIAIYNLDDMTPLKVLYSKNKEDRILSLAQSAGGMYLNEDTLLWCTPASLSLHLLDLKDLKSKEIVFEYGDKDFRVQNINEDIANMINSDRQSVLDFINSNSRIIQVNAHKDNIHIVAETGIISQKKDASFDYTNRKIKIYVLDKTYIPCISYRFSYPPYCSLVRNYSKHLYSFRAEFTEKDFLVILDKYNIDSARIFKQ